MMPELSHIPGQPDYRISKDGRVFCLSPRYWIKNDVPHEIKQRDVRGYRKVTLRDGTNSGKTVSVHRLVMLAFHGPCPDGMVVNHKNGIRSDNRVDNLEYTTPQGNSNHAVGMGSYDFGERHHSHKLRTEQVSEIKKKLLEGESTVSLGKMYSVSENAIWKIKTRRSWRHVK